MHALSARGCRIDTRFAIDPPGAKHVVKKVLLHNFVADLRKNDGGIPPI